MADPSMSYWGGRASVYVQGYHARYLCSARFAPVAGVELVTPADLRNASSQLKRLSETLTLTEILTSTSIWTWITTQT